MQAGGRNSGGNRAWADVIEPIEAKTAFGRVGEPEDIGMMIATLLSEESRWITAQSIEVSGGYGL
ncbi:SDR family oxidoreductase [Streptomyces sp. CJ_13]|uniref:SDR family oxidoreductase n=1 Tax=Streptomyces goshikiensis TaxID=1942 RepID=UPI001BDC7F55|nr:SDR family oxidoreductase [Streptomyces sp. CJ_13]